MGPHIIEKKNGEIKLIKNPIVPSLGAACEVIVSFKVSVRYEQKLNQENEKKEKILAAKG
ncbi:MAG: hypothetical protein CM15mP12_0620 [Gammaproteobacteria bacterium]|nr:MAG: hypothetical protein CM15mP12_0620 [Gammaproteobacteria bacterium]